MPPSVPLGHPLFPRRTGTADPEIGFIHVRRRDASGWKRAAKTFAAADLTSEGALAVLYGGGEYELVARCSRNRRITTRVRLRIAGDPKPLDAAPSTFSRPKRTEREILEMHERGKVHAKVFRLFEKNRDLHEVVRAARLPVEEVRRLWAEYSKPLDLEASALLEHTQDYEREAEKRERQRLEHTRTEREEAWQRKRYELVDRMLRIREKELELARKDGVVERPMAKPIRDAEDTALTNLLSAFLQVAEGQGR